MSRIDELLDIFAFNAAHPKAVIDNFHAETGKGAVGILPVYAPEEIIHASGRLPVGIWGAQIPVSKVRTYMASFGCSIMQSTVELALNGAYDDLEAVVISAICDTLKGIQQSWKGKSPVIMFSHPQHRKSEHARKYLVAEYENIRVKLETILGEKISDEKIAESIRIYNRHRAAMRRFSEVAAKHTDIITATVRHHVYKSALFMEKGAHTAIVDELIAELIKLPESCGGKRILLTGLTAEPDGLLDLIEEYGMKVVGDDLAQETRQYRTDVPEGDEPPIERLAQQWQNHEGCSLAFDPEKKRIPMLMDLYKERQASGIVLCMMKFCDPEEFDYPVMKDIFEKAGIPLTVIEIDQQDSSFGVAGTRLMSFSEMIEEV